LKTDTIKALFAAVDSKDAAAFGELISDDCRFRFGNQEFISGKEPVMRYVAGFFGSIQDLRHEILDTWSVDDAIICQGYVTYIRHNGSSLTVPFANVLKLAASQIREYLIFADTSALYIGK
jgi:ketosteroid isomerase-like protein